MSQTPFDIPDGLTLETVDVSAGDWLDERLLPLHVSNDGVLVGEIVPTGFEAYARILHPARRRDEAAGPGGLVTWAQVARERDKQMHPEVQFQALVDAPLDPRVTEIEAFERPEEGSFPRHLCEPLLEVLGRYTATPERCAFCIWDGYGLFEGGTQYLVAGRRWSGWLEPRRMRRDARQRARAEWEVTRGIPRVRIHPDADRRGALREYFLLWGPLRSLTSFVFEGIHFQSPNLWWPEDHSWVVATEIDDWSTYVGGSRACVEELLASPGLEVVPSGPELRFDVRGDRVNAPGSGP